MYFNCWRTLISDPNGQGHFTALGILVAIERVLGLNGGTPAAGGIYLPETLLSVDSAYTRMEKFGVEITTISTAVE